VFADGRRFRILAIVDDFTHECLALVADTSLLGLRVARELSALIIRRGRPSIIVSDRVEASAPVVALNLPDHSSQ
jgi:putative transposase